MSFLSCPLFLGRHARHGTQNVCGLVIKILVLGMPLPHSSISYQLLAIKRIGLLRFVKLWATLFFAISASGEIMLYGRTVYHHT
jgi:hypothetical protein